jgi:hypothetical protein
VEHDSSKPKSAKKRAEILLPVDGLRARFTIDSESYFVEGAYGHTTDLKPHNIASAGARHAHPHAVYEIRAEEKADR